MVNMNNILFKFGVALFILFIVIGPYDSLTWLLEQLK